MIDVSKAQGRLGSKTRLEEMTWPEILAAIENGQTTVVAAAGSMEQHGPHLPLQTDTLLGTFLAAAIVARIPGALQGPTIPFGESTHHMPFAGTISLTKETFKLVVLEYVGSLAQHGFMDIAIVPSHGGNFGPLAELVAETGGIVNGARLHCFTDLMDFVAVLNAVALQDDIDPGVAGAHAGESETSLVLAAREKLVQMDFAEAGYVGEFGPDAAELIFREGMPALTNNGILGDARPADRDRGFEYRDALADYLAGWILERIPQ